MKFHLIQILLCSISKATLSRTKTTPEIWILLSMLKRRERSLLMTIPSSIHRPISIIWKSFKSICSIKLSAISRSKYQPSFQKPTILISMLIEWSARNFINFRSKNLSSAKSCSYRLPAKILFTIFCRPAHAQTSKRGFIQSI